MDQAKLANELASVRHRQGRVIGRMEALGFGLRSEAALRTLTEDVVRTSEIEGEILDRAQVRSSWLVGSDFMSQASFLPAAMSMVSSTCCSTRRSISIDR